MDTLQNERSFGRLIVRTTAASGAIPIAGATVIVRKTDENGVSQMLGTYLTDINGLTEPLTIETPNLSESLSPGGKQPFSEITTEVSADGYFSTTNINIPIYPGITSIQPVSMVPIPESQNGANQPSSDIIFDNGMQRPNL